jgi:hypothetical protein
VAHWKAELDKLPSGPKAGILWKSGVMNLRRSHHFSQFEMWKPILNTEGLVWINLQYGDASNEISLAAEKWGIQIHTLEGLDLKQDLDDICALSKALDMVVGPMNASTNIAAAAGTPFYLLWPRTAWTLLGSQTMPWYPDVKVFSPETVANRSPAIKELATSLAEDTQKKAANAA